MVKPPSSRRDFRGIFWKDAKSRKRRLELFFSNIEAYEI